MKIIRVIICVLFLILFVSCVSSRTVKINELSSNEFLLKSITFASFKEFKSRQNAHQGASRARSTVLSKKVTARSE